MPPKVTLKVTVDGNNPQIDVNPLPRDSFATVIAVEVPKDFQVYNSPDIQADHDIFMDTAQFKISTDIDSAVIHYTTDGSMPVELSPVAENTNKVILPASFTLKAACFLKGKAVSGVSEKYFFKEMPVLSVKNKRVKPGLLYRCYEGQWDKLPDFDTLKAAENGICNQPDLSVKKHDANYGLVFSGYLSIPETNVYQLQLSSDDGSALRIDGKTLMNDGAHAMVTKNMDIALEKGLHPVEIQFFQGGGDEGLTVAWKTGNKPVQKIPAENWYH